jgi:cytochrome c
MACNSAAEPGNPQRGAQVFNTPVRAERGNLEPCAECHPTQAGQPPKTGLGTNFANIASRAGAMVAGQSAEEYLRTSIIDPDAFLAGGFQDGLMSREYKKLLTPQQIEDLVAYLMTLK